MRERDVDFNVDLLGDFRYRRVSGTVDHDFRSPLYQLFVIENVIVIMLFTDFRYSRVELSFSASSKKVLMRLCRVRLGKSKI